MATKQDKGSTVLEFDQDAIKKREEEVGRETDEEILARLKERFDVLTEMAIAVKRGVVKALIVSGPPGVGKSFNIDTVLTKDDLFMDLAGKKKKYEFVKGGAISALGLYCKLHEYKDKGNVVVFDDCDSVLMDEVCLNILKGALDSSEKRWISWNTDSRLLRSEDIPDRFEFKGSVIFITNLKFDFVKSKRLKEHLAALESRCHYIDLQMDTQREKMLRINQIVNDSDMLERYEFAEGVKEEILQFIDDNKHKLRELSLRMVLKIADLYKSFPKAWKATAATTCMRRTI
jgi:hypothetical protein